MNVVGSYPIVEHGWTELFLAIEQPSQVAAWIAYSKDVDVHAASSFNGLNGAQRLNVWNDWN
jgi:hypothetical protein